MEADQKLLSVMVKNEELESSLNMDNMESRKSKPPDVNSTLQVQELQNQSCRANKIDGSSLIYIKATSKTALDKVQTLIPSGSKTSRNLMDLAQPSSFASTNIQVTNHQQWVECHICKKKFKYFSGLRKHLPTHSTAKQYVCHICGKAYKHSCSLSTHKLTHNKSDLLTCDICKEKFSRLSILNNHRLKHDSLTCNICGKAFAEKWYLLQHQITHSEIKPFKCEICKAEFHQSGNLLTHKFKMHRFLTKKEVVYICQFCKKQFKKQLDLKKHKLIAHPKENLYACDSCMKTFLSRYELNKHYTIEHPNNLHSQNQHEDIQYIADDPEGFLFNDVVYNNPSRTDPNHFLSENSVLKDFVLNGNRHDFCNSESVSVMTKNSALQDITREDTASKDKVNKNTSFKACEPTYATSLNPVSQKVTTTYVNPVINDVSQGNFTVENCDFENFLPEYHVFDNTKSVKINSKNAQEDINSNGTKLKSAIVPNEGSHTITLESSKDKIFELKVSEETVSKKQVSVPKLRKKEVYKGSTLKRLMLSNVLSDDDTMEIESLKKFENPLCLKKHELVKHPKQNQYACDASMKTSLSRDELNNPLSKELLNYLQNKNQHKGIQYFSDDSERFLFNNVVYNKPSHTVAPNHFLPEKNLALKDFVPNGNRYDFCNADLVRVMTKDSALQNVRHKDTSRKDKVNKNILIKSCVPTYATTLNPVSQKVTSTNVNPVVDALIDCILPNSVNTENDLLECFMPNDIGINIFTSENNLSDDVLQGNFTEKNFGFKNYSSECNVLDNTKSLKKDSKNAQEDNISNGIKLKSNIVPKRGLHKISRKNSKDKVFQLKVSKETVSKKEVCKPELCKNEAYKDILLESMIPANISSEDDAMEIHSFKDGVKEITPANVLHTDVTLSSNSSSKDCNKEN